MKQSSEAKGMTGSRMTSRFAICVLFATHAAPAEGQFTSWGKSALAGLSEVGVVVTTGDLDPPELEIEPLEAYLKMRLRQARIEVAEGMYPHTERQPFLHVDLSMWPAPVYPGRERWAVNIDLTVQQTVCVSGHPNECSWSGTWRDQSIRVFDAVSMQADVQAALAEKMDRLLNDWVEANP